MADEAARRREIRRQRILANSESRLRRILNNEEDNVLRQDPSSQPAPDQPEQPPISVVASVSSLENLPNARLKKGSIKGSLKNCEPNADQNGGTRQPLREAGETPSIGSALANTRTPVQSNCNPIASMDLTDIPADELPLFGQEAYEVADIRQQLLSQMGNHLEAMSSMGAFDSSHLAQLISNFASSNESPLASLANFAGQLGLQEPGQEVIITRKDKRSTCDIDRRHYQVLWDASYFHRILIIVLLAVLARFILPVLPTDYALMFGPLYFLEVLLISLCIVYAVPLDRSRMSFAFNLLLLFGAPPRPVQFGRTLTTCFELFFRDMSTYAFAFFVTHALCQHANNALATTS